jgi:hypothetical protein
MFQSILYAFLLILVSSTYNYMEDTRYELKNREILYNKWDHIQVEPIVYNKRMFRIQH